MDMDFEFTFTDQTILEANEYYDEVNRLMLEEATPSAVWVRGKRLRAESSNSKEWMIRTHLTIDSNMGVANFLLHLYNTKRVLIVEYSPSVGNVLYNPDIPALRGWADHHGWNDPEPATQLVKDDIDFWKHYWQSLQINSPYLESVFGPRPHDPATWFNDEIELDDAGHPDDD